MPPRRSGRAAASAAATAPAAQPLDGTVIAISGTFDQKRTEIESLLTSLGAGIAKSVTKKTTHLITTQQDFNAVTTKVAAAQKNDIHIVSLEWAQECETQGSKASEDDFTVSAQSNSQPKQAPQQKPAAAATNGSKKNGAASQAGASQQNGSSSQADAAPKAASGSRKKRVKDEAQSDNDSDTKPDVKKQKAAKVTKRKRDDSAAPADAADVKTDVKKGAAAADANKGKAVANGQVAASKALVIPLDEGCKAQGAVYIAPDGVIYDASLNQTNATNNNNKFYRIQVCFFCSL